MLRAHSSGGGKVRRSGRGAGNTGNAYGGDPYFSNVVSLLHFNGADLSTTFTDVTGKVWTETHNNASYQTNIQTAQSVFGGASLHVFGQLDGAPFPNYSYISTPDHADFDFGSGDFTIELWVRPQTVLGNGRGLYAQPNAGNYSPVLIYQNGTTYNVFMSSNGSAWDMLSAGVIGTAAQDTWAAIAVVRQGSNVYTYMDGTKANTYNVGSGAVFNSTGTPRFGAAGSTGDPSFYGYIDEARITKGLARYSGATYALQTSEFPDN